VQCRKDGGKIAPFPFLIDCCSLQILDTNSQKRKQKLKKDSRRSTNKKEKTLSTMTMPINTSSSSSSSSSGNKVSKTFGSGLLLVVLSCLIALHAQKTMVHQTTQPSRNLIEASTALNITSSNDSNNTDNDNYTMIVSPVTALASNSSSTNGNDNELFCRLTKELSLGPSMIMQEQPPVICVTIVDDEEHDDFVLDDYLSRKLYDRHNFHGDMFATMTGVAVEKKTRTLTGNDNTVITVVDAPVQHARRVMEASKGNRTLAIVRVSARDSEFSISTQDLLDQVLNDSDGAVNVITQYRTMSHRKFQLVSNGVFNVFVNESMVEYPNMSGMYDDINAAAVQQLGVTHLSALADKVMICHPPGHTNERIAWTHHLGWRAHYKEEWCASLCATYVLNCFVHADN
jgi:hypothetical protein